MTIFLNMKTSYGVETVDEFTKDEKQPVKEFKAYISKMISEYHLAGMNVYQSSRPIKEWKRR